MGQLQVLADVIAVAAGRLMAIVRVEGDGSVVVRDLGSGALSTTSASIDLQLLDEAAASSIYKLPVEQADDELACRFRSAVGTG